MTHLLLSIIGFGVVFGFYVYRSQRVAVSAPYFRWNRAVSISLALPCMALSLFSMGQYFLGHDQTLGNGVLGVIGMWNCAVILAYDALCNHFPVKVV